MESLELLGHSVDSKRIKPFPENATAIANCPCPTSQRRLRHFLGLISFYRRFISNYAKVAQPLTDLLRKDTTNTKQLELSEATVKAFEELKQALSKVTTLSHMSNDPEARLVLITDASQETVGAVLQQAIQGEFEPLAFFSQRLQPTQTRYSRFG